jgi:hypothetical protein
VSGHDGTALEEMSYYEPQFHSGAARLKTLKDVRGLVTTYSYDDGAGAVAAKDSEGREERRMV